MNTEKKESSKKFTKGYTFKAIVIAALVLLLLIPLSMIGGLVRDRERTAREAESGIMEAWGGELVLAGPVLVFPGSERVTTRTQTEKEGEIINVSNKPVRGILTPKTLNISANFKTEVRKRGIFSVPLYSGEITISGTFDKSMFRVTDSKQTYTTNDAALVISLGSQKGIKKITSADWNGKALFFEPGNDGNMLFNSGQVENGNYDYVRVENGNYNAGKDNRQGIHAALDPFPDDKTNEAAFSITMEIQGGRLARFLPAAQDTHIEMSADWASPSFQGAFLPASSQIDDAGFSAVWDVSYLSRDIPLSWVYRETEGAPVYGSLFGVDFFRPIDTYALNTRAVKYAILFLIVPFLTLFLLEIFAKTRIHPVPYTLSGIGNAVFYLLLLSLSEQMPFYTAYTLAACAVTAMMALYSRALLPSWRKCWYMGFVVTLSYILLYAVLNAQSYALIIGSTGTFVVIALVMFITRKLDWYGEEG